MTKHCYGSVSSVGRASCLCRDGQGFDPLMEHSFLTNATLQIQELEEESIYRFFYLSVLWNIVASLVIDDQRI